MADSAVSDNPPRKPAGLKLIQAPWSGRQNVFAVTTTRLGGYSDRPFDDGLGGQGLNLAHHVGDQPAAVSANRASLMSFLPASPIWLNQIHGRHVFDMTASPSPLAKTGNCPPSADAAITNRPGQVLAIMTADCLPVLFVDQNAGVIGAAHAGWRGLAAGVLIETIAAMVRRGADAASMSAWIGPAIGKTVFEVGAEVPAAFAESPAFSQATTDAHFVAMADRPGKWLGDLPGLARAQMLSAGLASVSGGEHCTVNDKRFFSYRRDAQTGRMASLIWLGPQ